MYICVETPLWGAGCCECLLAASLLFRHVDGNGCVEARVKTPCGVSTLWSHVLRVCWLLLSDPEMRLIGESPLHSSIMDRAKVRVQGEGRAWLHAYHVAAKLVVNGTKISFRCDGE